MLGAAVSSSGLLQIVTEGVAPEIEVICIRYSNNFIFVLRNYQLGSLLPASCCLF